MATSLKEHPMTGVSLMEWMGRNVKDKIQTGDGETGRLRQGVGRDHSVDSDMFHLMFEMTEEIKSTYLTICRI